MIERCVCQNVTFARIHDMICNKKLPLAEVVELTGAGEKCGMCRPYISHVIATGQTSIAVDTKLQSKARSHDARRE